MRKKNSRVNETKGDSYIFRTELNTLDGAEVVLFGYGGINKRLKEVLNAFWSTPRTIQTQHTGGRSADEVDRKIGVFTKNLKRYLNRQSLNNIVDFERGY